MSNPILLKIITTGDGGVGKTTLLYRYVEGRFVVNTLMTLGVEFFMKELEIDGRKINLQVWDFGGQEHFRPLLKNYSMGARGALLLFDLTRPSSLEHIDQWVNICRGKNPDIPIMFLGTKSDLKESINVDEEFASKIPQKYDFFNYLKISSKTGENVNLAFELLAKEIIKKL
ncbi:MAG: GTP-binding protein [Promethearchaeota archaeon]|jgi:small GTP-binding protein